MKLYILLGVVAIAGAGASELEEHTKRAARQFGVPVEYIHAVILLESQWEPDALNTSNFNGSHDIGLMQLNSNYIPFFAERFWDGDTFDPWDPEHNIMTGTAYLAYLHQRMGNWYDALVAYNAGPTRTMQGRAPEMSLRYAETVLYIAYTMQK